jgi:hypothetical protein
MRVSSWWLGVLLCLAVGAPACAVSADDDAIARAWRDALERRRAALTERLDALETRDELLVAAELARPDARARAHVRLLDRFPDDPLALHAVAAYCGSTDAAESAPCAGRDAIAAYADADPDNAWPWLLWAARAHRAGDAPEAAWAVDRAARAERSTWYATETLRPYDRFVESVETPDGRRPPRYVRFTTTLGYFLALAVPSLSDILANCPDPTRDASLSDARRTACYRVGQLLAAASTQLDRTLGSLLMRRHAATPEQRRAAVAASVRNKALSLAAAELLDIGEDPTAAEQRTVEAYAADLLDAGEMRAMERLVARSGERLEDWMDAARRLDADAHGP